MEEFSFPVLHNANKIHSILRNWFILEVKQPKVNQNNKVKDQLMNIIFILRNSTGLKQISDISLNVGVWFWEVKVCVA